MAMINGRITAHSELVPGILWAHGFQIEQLMTGTPYADDWTAQCKLTRPGGTTITRMFSVADAKKAGLWSPNARIKRKGRNSDYEVDNDSPWHRYPQRMLMARALGFAAKDGGSDAMRGMMVSEESGISCACARRATSPITTSESSTAPSSTTARQIRMPRPRRKHRQSLLRRRRRSARSGCDGRRDRPIASKQCCAMARRPVGRCRRSWR